MSKKVGLKVSARRIEIPKNCGNCQYWNCDTGFCDVKMIITSRKEICEHWGSVNEVLY